MPRRASARTIISNVPAHSEPSLTGTALLPLSSDLLQLRRQWKWAAFSQFFFTFSSLFAMPDVSLTDIEDDLVNSTTVFLPRVMQRLLYTLTQDRKISADNWQTALRKQYYKRDPDANPIGPEPVPLFQEAPAVHSRGQSVDASGALVGEKLDGPSTTPSRQPTPLLETSTEAREDTACLSERESAPAETQPEEQQPYADDGERADSKDWLDLPMLIKLDSLHHLIEWQFHNPIRLRTIMKDDDETAQWRIEPIGYDSKRTAHWLIGADRLWIQREIPKPPKTLKRKRPPGTQKVKASTSKSHGQLMQSSKRQRTQRELLDNSPPDVFQDVQQLPTGPRGRAAKIRANLKIDAQAKELAELQRQASDIGRRSSSRTQLAPPRHPLGTRVSARLRGNAGEEEWQVIPDEWLADSAGSSSGTASNKREAPSMPGSEKPLLRTGLENDLESISDLTELSEESEEVNGHVKEDDGLPDKARNASVEHADEDGAANDRDKDLEGRARLPDDFVEWETICVTLKEWEHIADRFQKATHYAEKSLYNVLTKTIVPVVTADLREAERKRCLEDAVVHRKRSSRIAIKESEKEEARMIAKKRADEEEKLSRTMRLKARLEKEEGDRAMRESAREQRKREREAKERQQLQKLEEGSDSVVDVTGNDPLHPGRNFVVADRPNGALNGTGSGSRTPTGDDWELDCEVCCKRGVNQTSDDSPMLCCSSCSRWQHILCHDNEDIRAGRPKRNWDLEDFVCERCRAGGFQSSVRNVNGYRQPIRQGVAQDHRYLGPSQSLYSVQGSAPYMHPPGTLLPTSNYRQPHPQAMMKGTSRFRTHNTGTPAIQQIRPPLSPSPITFAHYQPQQHGFSQATRPTSNLTYAQPASSRSHLQQYPPVGNYALPYTPPRPTQTSTNGHSSMGWNTSPYPYGPYVPVTEQQAGCALVSTYPHYNGTTTPRLPATKGAEQSLNQFPQLQYHETSGSTPYQS